jgi:hypothetical protein
MAGACATQEERDLAEDKCQSLVIRGIGQNTMPYGGAPMPASYHPYNDTRWGNAPPCTVAELPICDCTNDLEAVAVAHCLAGSPPPNWSQDYQDTWCGQIGAGKLMGAWCPGNQIPEMPPCLEEGARAGLSYCTDYGFGGSNPGSNALCWTLMKAGTLPPILGLPDCPPGAPPSFQFDVPPVPTTELPPNGGEGRTERSAMMLPGLILLAVVAGGTAYYFAQRKGK